MTISHSEFEDCQAAIFEKAHQPLDLRKLPIPQPRQGEILVRIEACTICGSDIHTVLGNRQEKTPTILGHEIVGTVQAIGSSDAKDADGIKLESGDRVTWSVCISCGECSRCSEGLPQKCLHLRKIGHERLESNTGLIGGFAEYILLPVNTTVFKINETIASEIICPVNCATATTVSAFNPVEPVAGKTICIIGAGLLGLTACAMAKTKGARQILMVEPDAHRRQLSLKFGATNGCSDFQELGESNHPIKFDVIMDFSGSTSAIENALPFTDIGGHFVLVGSVSPNSGCHWDPEFLVRNLIHVHGIHNYAPTDLKRAIEFLEEAGTRFPFNGLVAKSFPLSEINEAVDFAITNKPIRVMIRP